MAKLLKGILIFSNNLLGHSILDAMTFLRKARISKLLMKPGLLPQREEAAETVFTMLDRFIKAIFVYL